MYTNRQAHEAQPVGEREVRVFFWKVFIAFLNEHLADLFQVQFDGWYGGDLEQYRRCQYTRVNGNVEEMYMPGRGHRTRIGGGHSTPRFNEDVWTCLEPATERSRNFDPQWDEVDRRMKEADEEYKRLP